MRVYVEHAGSIVDDNGEDDAFITLKGEDGTSLQISATAEAVQQVQDLLRARPEPPPMQSRAHKDPRPAGARPSRVVEKAPPSDHGDFLEEDEN